MTSETPSPVPTGRAPLPLLGLGLLVCGLYVFAEQSLLGGRIGFPLDDSWIHLQFARNLAQGAGLSYNPGELVTGSTAPLWTALLSLLFLLPAGAIVVATKLLGVALHLAGIDAVWRLARALGLGRKGAALAALLHLSTSWMVWSALSGMEIPLFVVLSLWGMVLHTGERRDPRRLPLSLPVFGVAALARPEGLLLLTLAGLDRLLPFALGEPAGALPVPPEAPRLRRQAVKSLAAGAGLAALALAGPLLFYRWAGGSFLPTTFAAKGGSQPHWLSPNLQYLHVVLGIFFAPQPWMTLAAGGGALRLAGRLGGDRDRGLLPALWLAGLPLAYSFLTPGANRMLGNFGRYYFPLFPVLIVLGVLGLQPAGRALAACTERLRRPVRVALAAAGALLLLVPTFSRLPLGASFYAQNVANVEDSDVRLGRWLAARLPPEAVLAVNDIGAIRYLAPNRIIDLASIATPDVGREVARDVALGRPPGLAMVDALERRRPDYVAVFPSWVPAVGHDPRFTPVYTLSIPGNVTMGDDEIVVYATPWTRFPLRPGG